MKQWTLSQSSFDAFLANLDADRERAGQKYEAIRARLVKFFEWRACEFADGLADETLDRVARKIDSGEQINDCVNYTYAVARLVFMESLKRQSRKQAVVIKMPVRTELNDEDSRLNCLEICLEKLSEKNRTMILHYYRDDKQAKIDYRKKLAETLGISLNALRIKTLRVRSKLEECVFKCLKNNAA
jgi:DNA-directed RNA polymerase specialized sigma24 family protein